MVQKRAVTIESEKAAETVAAIDLADALELQVRVQKLYDKALQSLNAAEAQGDLKAVASFMREARENIVLSARLQGLLGESKGKTIDARRQTVVLGHLGEEELNALIQLGKESMKACFK